MATSDTTNNFLKPKGDYKNLVAYKKSECIYDMTFFLSSTIFHNTEIGQLTKWYKLRVQVNKTL